jgi:hypothetical protein
MTAPRRDRPVSRLALPAALLLGWGALAGWVLPGWPLNADEGFYLSASHALAGALWPYHDYAYTQMPWLPLLQAPFFAVVPPSLTALRALSLAWTTLAFALAYRILAPRVGPWKTAVAFGLLLLAPQTLGFLAIGKTYPLAQFLFLLAAGALFSPARGRTGYAVLAVAGVLCIGVRLTMAPAVAVLGLGYWRLHREIPWTWALGVPAAAALVLIGPFASRDPLAFTFFNWGFHTASLAPRHPPGFWADALRSHPGIWVLLAVALAVNGRRISPFSVLLGAAVAGLAANLAWAGTYLEYVTPFILAAIVGAFGVLAENPRPLRDAAALGAAVVLGLLLFSWPAATRCEADCAAAARFLAAHTPPGARVLASMPEVPVEAGRPIFRDLLMGKFTVTGDFPSAVARHIGYIHIADLVDCVHRVEPAAIVLSTRPTGNFYYSLPSELVFTHVRRDLVAEMAEGYDLAYANPTYLVLLPRAVRLAAAPSPLPGW